MWATAQYLNYARPPSVMDIDVTVASAGHQTTQARAVAHVGDREILTVNAALGDRSFPESGQWVERPSVPDPDDCPPRESQRNVSDSILSRLDQRWALQGGDGSGRCAVWSRMPDLLGVSAPALAVLGDYVPLGLGVTLENDITSNSLDNTLRVANLVPTEWVLLDIRVHAVERGFGHGLVHMFAEDGTLLATASQSCIVRFWKGEEPGERAAPAGQEGERR